MAMAHQGVHGTPVAALARVKDFTELKAAGMGSVTDLRQVHTYSDFISTIISHSNHCQSVKSILLPLEWNILEGVLMFVYKIHKCISALYHTRYRRSSVCVRSATDHMHYSVCSLISSCRNESLQRMFAYRFTFLYIATPLDMPTSITRTAAVTHVARAALSL